jgi:hypothetical protein
MGPQEKSVGYQFAAKFFLSSSLMFLLTGPGSSVSLS